MKTEKEILEAVRVLQEANPHDEGIQNWVRNYFPELKESEDERIRKALINGFNKLDKSAVWYNGITNGQILAWLEKQQKPVIEMKMVSESLGFTTQKECDDYNKMVTDLIMSDDGKGEQKPANKVEPKFKVGDNIEPIDSCLGSPLTIYKICDGFYKTNQGTLDFEFENNWRLVEQKSAWSEEDESMLNFVKVVLNKHKNDAFFDKFETTLNDCLTWFRNIKSRVGCEVNCTTKQQWKPSDEQMRVLDLAIKCGINRGTTEGTILVSLFDDLKKLKD